MIEHVKKRFLHHTISSREVISVSIVSLFPDTSKPENTDQETFEREVAARFGLVPNFFRSAPEAPLVLRELWLFAKSAYLDAPIPTLFKERLFVYLSRFCEIRYCITRHCGFLLGLGRSAGDPGAQPTSHSFVAATDSFRGTHKGGAGPTGSHRRTDGVAVARNLPRR